MAESYQVLVNDLARFKKNHEYFQQVVNQEVVGYNEVVTDLLIAMLAKGHVLLEGVPGVAKTTLAKAFAKTLGMSFHRVQFTQDLMPMDITGHFVFDQQKRVFELRKGPVFTNLLLADEINRAPPKTQSAMLETMEERQVTIEGQTIPMEKPFMVVATMNPIDSEGVYRLPEAQKDRFMIRTKMHYLAPELEERMLKLKIMGSQVGDDQKRLKIEAMLQGQELAGKIHVGDETLRYLQRVAAKTRDHPDINVGASPRSMVQMLNASRAYALISGRPYVLPDDIRYVAPRILNHRLILRVDAEAKGKTTDDVIREVLNAVPAPKVVMK
ncbi:MAG TPA: MoxR family ATPase [Candidatus Thermoplasmatota archaeon]|nr:MoxR family ATPase [Candidatus Thermoplasmatota archaeon]